MKRSVFCQNIVFVLYLKTYIIILTIEFPMERKCFLFMNQRLHEQLKLLREERNWTLEDLSKKTQIGVEKLAQYESGALIPSLQTILKLSNALEVPASNLTDGLTL